VKFSHVQKVRFSNVQKVKFSNVQKVKFSNGYPVFRIDIRRTSGRAKRDRVFNALSELDFRALHTIALLIGTYFIHSD
jgi:hypothetical protein